MSLHDVPRHIGFAPKAHPVRFAPRRRRFQYPVMHRIRQRGRTGLVIVIDDVEQAVHVAAIQRTVTPIKQHVVHEIEIVRHRDARIATRIARQQIVMKPRVPPAPVTAKRMVVQVQRLRDNAPLNGVIHRRQLQRRPAARRVIHVAIRVQGLVIAPARRAMVNDDVAHRAAGQPALPLENARIAATETHVPDNHIVRVVHHALTRDADAITRRTLSRHRHIRRLNVNRHLQVDDTRHIEHHRARTRRFQRLA